MAVIAAANPVFGDVSSLSILTSQRPSTPRRLSQDVAISLVGQSCRKTSHLDLLGHVADKPLLRDAGGCISDGKLAEFPVVVPRRRSEILLERYQLYAIIERVYSAVTKGSGYSSVISSIQSLSAAEKRIVYETVFEVMHYQEVVDEIMFESSFYSRYFNLHGNEALVTVMAYDFQKERFGLYPPRTDQDMIPESTLKVAEALWKHKVKLGATLARMRVKENAPTMAQLLPEEARKEVEQVSSGPYHARVNSRGGSNVEDILSRLHAEGYYAINSVDQLSACTTQKSVLHVKRDLLAFSPLCRMALCSHPLVKEGHLVLQDFASYDFVESLRPLIMKYGGDVILTNCNSGMEAYHIASILGTRGTVLAFGATPAGIQELNEKTFKLQLSNVHFIQEPFKSAVSHREVAHFPNVSLIVCLPPSSLSAVTHPVDFLLQEGDHHLPWVLGSAGQEVQLRTLATEQLDHLSHALTFLPVKHIVYFTRSCHDIENGSVVQQALDRHGAAVEKGECQRDYDIIMADSERDANSLEYYSVVLHQKPEQLPPKPLARDVIAQAIASGVLNLGSQAMEAVSIHTHVKPKSSSKKKLRRTFSHHEGIPMTIAASRKVKKKVTQDSKKYFR